MFYVDVRSPKEYKHAHIPGAYFMPLFSDLERAEVGTLYKQIGKKEAFTTALDHVVPKLDHFLMEAESFPSPFTIYCWRGGMRSNILHQFFSQVGISSQIMNGGYKSFRRWVLEFLSNSFCFKVLAGLTGSGKTEMLQNMKREGEQVLDLEKLANHKGSVFGSCGEQPSNEHFENMIAVTLRDFLPDKPIWVENESRLIGRCKIPDNIFDQMRRAPKREIVLDREERKRRLLVEYGFLPADDLVNAIQRLNRRMGSQLTNEAVTAVNCGDLTRAADILLTYYDRTYKKEQI